MTLNHVSIPDEIWNRCTMRTRLAILYCLLIRKDYKAFERRSLGLRDPGALFRKESKVYLKAYETQKSNKPEDQYVVLTYDRASEKWKAVPFATFARKRLDEVNNYALEAKLLARLMPQTETQQDLSA